MPKEKGMRRNSLRCLVAVAAVFVIGAVTWRQPNMIQRAADVWFKLNNTSHYPVRQSAGRHPATSRPLHPAILKWRAEYLRRSEFTPNQLFPLLNITNATSVADAERLFHTNIAEVEVSCPQSARLGNSADGGWNVCLSPPYDLKQPCLVYSFGINNDWSFDDHVTKQYNCIVRAFDPSMTAADHRRGTNIWFFKTGVSGADQDEGQNPRHWRLRTIGSLVEALNDTNTLIDYLKVDVEYSEWDAFERAIRDNSANHALNKVKQLAFEIHTSELHKKKSSVPDYVRFSAILKGLHDMGFRRWYTHFNHFGVFKSLSGNQMKLSCCYELSYINLNYFEILGLR